jgi:hypothetical protein
VFVPVIWPGGRPGAARTLPPGTGRATVVTDTGDIFGIGGNQPFHWTPDRVGQPLATGGPDPDGAVYGAAGAYAVGYARHQDDNFPHPLRWNLSTGELTALPDGVELLAVAPDGTAVGDLYGDGTVSAAMVRGTTVQRLPAAHAIDDTELATGITAAGDTVVGWGSHGSDGGSAIVWHC